MPKEKDLVINEWYKGIADSPNLGFGAIRNIDIHSTPGSIQANLRPDKVTEGLDIEFVKWFDTDPRTGYIYALDSNNDIFRSTNEGATWTLFETNNGTGATGQGFKIWKDYIFHIRDKTIGVVGPLSGTPTETTTWKSGLESVDFGNFVEATHSMLVAQNDVLYFGNGRYVGSISENTGQTFDPSNSATFTFSLQALDLPDGYKVRCLEELGSNLMIGTWKGSSIGKIKSADIFPWDTSSSSFGIPIRLSEYGVHAMLNMNNLLYIIAGVNGSVYVSNGTSTRLLRKIPNYLTKLQGGTYALFMPGAIAQQDGRIFFGMSSGGFDVTTPIFGVWSIDVNGTLAFEYQISTGSIDFNATRLIGAIHPISEGRLLISWRDRINGQNLYGIDRTDSDGRYEDYLASVQSANYRVGSPLAPTQFQEIDFILDEPLTEGDGIRIKYRRNLNEAFTTLGTYDFETEGPVDNFNKSFPSDGFVNLQFQIEPNKNARLREIRIR